MEYLVTGIVELNSKKSKVILNQEEEFALYKGELRRFHIETGQNLLEDDYQEIMTEILPKRARERCLNLLSVRAMTEQEVRRKLKDGYYPAPIIDQTLALLKKHRFVNDEDYAESYLQGKKHYKSKRQIQQDLMKKGISKDLIRDTLEDSDIDEAVNIQKLMVKKNLCRDDVTKEELQKFGVYLLRKGYDYEVIRKFLYNMHNILDIDL